MEHSNGHVVIVMAPMGSGKGVLVQHVRGLFPQITHTISCTTRARRPKESHGVEYFFLSREEFEEKIVAGEFVEWAEYGGHLYGTLKIELNDRLARGEIVICEIEVQGVLQLCSFLPKESRTIIYIDGGEWETLAKRARARAPITEEELALRRARYLKEIAHKDIADVIISNHDGELESARLRMEHVIQTVVENTTHA